MTDNLSDLMIEKQSIEEKIGIVRKFLPSVILLSYKTRRINKITYILQL